MPASLTEYREPLARLMLELHASRAALKQLRDRYAVCLFTGGDVWIAL